jgi:2-hydroxychromene-2-carboxylate isomerase
VVALHIDTKESGVGAVAATNTVIFCIAMKTITCYLDFISPYAYLAFEALPKALAGSASYQVVYKPVLFAALLKHHGQLGPAEIADKRVWTYRQVLWLAQQHGIPLDMPLAHPFNPLALLRLSLACATHGSPNRYVCETIFRHAWQGGAAADDPERLSALVQQLQPAQALDAPDVKAQLHANTDEAIAQGVFGVPAFAVDQHLFWGFDALPMLRQYLDGDAWFASERWQNVEKTALGITRKST